jgi:hypothetical protein
MREPFDAPVLGIDLGASFTKVSYRPGWTAGRTYNAPCRLLMIDDSALIPSLVIHTKDARKEWLCGLAAAHYRPKPAAQVFSNWKASLFGDKLTSRVSGSIIAAGEFFRWVRRKVSAKGIKIDQCRIKLCLPAFKDIGEAATILGQEMELAGWNNVSVSRIGEPRANTIGVFGEGRNRLYLHPIDGAMPYFMAMYPMGSPLLEHLRAFGLHGGPRHAHVAIVDVGSFTTDFSIIDFDASAEGDCITQTSQSSHRVGIIAGFEQPLLEYLRQEHGLHIEQLTFEEREAIKRVMAERGTFTVTIPGNVNVTIGTPADHDSAKRIANSFASDIRNVYDSNCKGKEIKYLILTGGGSVAPRVREALGRMFRLASAHWLDIEGLEGTSREHGDLRRWPNTGEPLARLATALGAASVLADLPRTPPPKEAPPRKKVVSPWVECSCRGGNKDCVRCGGRGMYRRKHR